MDANETAVAALYEAFARRDHEAMAALYVPRANFSDPAFGALFGKKIGAPCGHMNKTRIRPPPTEDRLPLHRGPRGGS